MTPNLFCYMISQVKEMNEILEQALLYDFYGELLTDHQKEVYEQFILEDLSLGEIGEALGVSRQAVCDNLTRTEALLRRMEENIGCVRRDRITRQAVQEILNAAEELKASTDPAVSPLAGRIIAAAQALKE